MNKRYFAVGAAKGWTQIRVAGKPPVAETTETVREVKEARLTWRDFNYVREYVPKKLRMRVTVFKGGRTLWTIKSRKLARLLKVGVREGGMIELMPEQADVIKKVMKRGSC